MTVNLIDKIGDWNPQLLRELKGRLKVFNVAIAVIVSLLLQVITFLYQLRELPGDKYGLTASYCNLREFYNQQQNNFYQQQNLLYQQLDKAKQIKPINKANIANLEADIEQSRIQINGFQKFLSNNFCPQNEIDWSLWWRDHWEYTFLTFSVIFIFTLLVAGTYLLINDLAKEERRGTLNFIRLSPQSEGNILTGKLLGVPILIYLIVLAAVPLHVWAGHSAKIALSYIFSYYVVLGACCIFFYNAALLFGLVSRWMGSFQPWLGSGAVLMVLFMTILMASSSYNGFNNSTAWLRMFNPWDVTNYLFPNLFRVYRGSPLKNLQFFYLPLGESFVTIVGFHLLNFGLCTYGITQALRRCFRNPKASMLSKKQSYLLVVFCQIMMWGFTIQHLQNYNLSDVIRNNFSFLALYNLILLFGLIAILSPQRQNIQDWARYRPHRVAKQQNFGRNSLWSDLIWGEKSPALVAIAINLAIVTIPWLAYSSILLDNTSRIKLIFAVALFISLMMIYATIAQLILLMKTSKRSLWAICIVGAAIFLPPTILQFLSLYAHEYPTLWLFSTFPWAGIEHSGAIMIFMSLLTELSVLALLNLQLQKRVKLAGESATKALLAS
ncbi:MAG: ABC transporter permease subunit [Desmonostoc vinosum HA7617-LM4]|jgi:hypothetical protein|nr:ABC transporter permease subunit [Desmonostoc vinosum HA7617-LM4]